VRLLVAAGRLPEADAHVAEAAALADRSQTPRTLIAAATTRAAYELATGRSDVALTRLDNALARAREVPATLRDTLACVIRAEEAAGNVERALARLEELSQHIYKFAIERAREHVELAGLRTPAVAGLDPRQAQARARLISKVRAPAPPDGWKTLQRLGVSAAMRMDPSGWHGMRVGALTKALATACGSSPLQALDIGLAAELHDIGMLSVPERILSKRGTLNDAERAIVERHVEGGAEILRDDRHPRMLLAREIARYHHARWDGNGYPERVGGKRIPLAARMCAVADAYDMMVCGFGGRAARTMDQALAELRKHSGKQFDPELVRCFDDLIRAETADRGMDLVTNGDMEGFQELILSLQEDRGFV
jgi:putative two-component system response regulator